MGSERGARRWPGAIVAAARATGISVPTIRKGIAELESGELGDRREMRAVALLAQLTDAGRVRRSDGGYGLLANVNACEGASHPDRDAQFEHMNQVAHAAVAAGQPAISVDTNASGSGSYSPTRRRTGNHLRWASSAT